MRLRRNDIKQYISYMIAMLLLALSGVGEPIGAVHTGLYVALIFAGENTLIVSIMYILAGIIVRPTLDTLIVSIVPAFVMSGLRFILDRRHRRMTIFMASMGAVLSMMPILVMSIIRSGKLIYGIMMILVMAVFTYLAIVAVFALVVKRLRYKLAPDEIASFLVIFAVMSMGLYSIDIAGFRIYYLFMVLMVLVAVSVLELAPSLAICLSFGLGAGISGHNLGIMGVIGLMTLVAYTFIRYNKYFAVVGVVAIDLVGGTYFGAFSEYNYLHLIAVAIGAVLFMIIPRRYLVYYRRIYSQSGQSSALVSFINRNRIDIGSKIDNLALLFRDIEEEMTRGEYVLSEEGWRNKISERIMCEICANCPSRNSCFKALGGDTMSQIVPIVEKAMLSKSSPDDASTFLESRCGKIVDIVDMSNSLCKQYAKIGTHIYDVLDNKRILGEEIGSIGKVLDKLSSSILEGVGSSPELERRIIEELNLVGIICHDALVVQYKNGDMELTLVVRNRDKDKRAIRRILEGLTHVKLDRYEDRVCEIEGFSTIRFLPHPRYMLSYGTAYVTKEGSKATGDSRSIVKLGGGKVAIVLCDGKGSGERANANSSATIGIIEKMYKAGFDSDTVLNFSNRLLSIRNSEDFSAIDLCIVDLKLGSIDFIKLGGVSSFIKRSSSVDVVEGSALPLGVLDEAHPSTARRVLSEGDTVVLVSDGITDSMGEDKTREMLINMDSSNVQHLADDILVKATEGGAIDDSTVIAFKLVKA